MPHHSSETTSRASGRTRPRPSAPSSTGDANLDGHVDGLDYAIWYAHAGTATAGGPTAGDFNQDGRVDQLDYQLWEENYAR